MNRIERTLYTMDSLQSAVYTSIQLNSALHVRTTVIFIGFVSILTNFRSHDDYSHSATIPTEFHGEFHENLDVSLGPRLYSV
mmetsp:Transcript_6531/g.11681  ORF Transcript_6531/g.11681 Transcript_6531/m.11681 type:complete len:82 (-) Transcript_6531:14-259(-)